MVRVRPDLVRPLAVELPDRQPAAPSTGSAVTLTPRACHCHVLLDGVPGAGLLAGASLAVTTTGLRVVVV